MKSLILALCLFATSAAGAEVRNYSVLYNPKSLTGQEANAKHFQLGVRFSAVASSSVSPASAVTGSRCTDNECEPVCRVSVSFPVAMAVITVADLDSQRVAKSEQSVSASASQEFSGACGEMIPSLPQQWLYSSTSAVIALGNTQFPDITLYLNVAKLKMEQVGADLYQVSTPTFDERLNGTVMYFEGGGNYDLRKIQNGVPENN